MNNDALRDYLPYLRPRSAEADALAIAVLVLIGLGLVAAVVLSLLRWRRSQQRLRELFRQRAQEQGLVPAQIDLLQQIARRQKMRHADVLLTSVLAFERHVGRFSDELATRQPFDPVLAEITRIRAVLGFDHVAADQPLLSTRHLGTGQTLMVWSDANPAQYATPWVVVQRDESALTVVPLLREDQRHVLGVRVGDQLAVRFWRERDTEYRFATRVLEIDADSQGLMLAHTSQVERLQQREFFRLDISFPIALYAIPKEAAEQLATRAGAGRPAEDETPEAQSELPAVDLATAPRLDGQVLNLSAGGLGLTTHGPIPAEHLFFVDPGFEGEFPLAGLVCEVVHQERSAEGTYLQMKFADLPPELEKEIVRRVFAEQTRAPEMSHHGRPTDEAPAPPEAADQPPGLQAG